MNITIRSISYMELVPCSTGFEYGTCSLFQDLNTEQCYPFKYGLAPLSVVVFLWKNYLLFYIGSAFTCCLGTLEVRSFPSRKKSFSCSKEKDREHYIVKVTSCLHICFLHIFCKRYKRLFLISICF